MKWQFEDKLTQGQFTVMIKEISLGGSGLLNSQPTTINTIVYNTGEDQQVIIDEVEYTFPVNTVLPLVANQHFRFKTPENLVAWQFNREFYCIADHDAEVGCVGFLFYGIEHPLFIQLSPEEVTGIATIEQLCIEDMDTRDRMQGEMLRTLLKRLIIKITRIAKKQSVSCPDLSDNRMDMVRRFNLLLECNFRSRHEVQFYAKELNKSPKTLTNIFGMCHYPSPSKLIQRRIILEAKRYLYYTDKSAKEIADDLGFTSAAHFSRFFKINTGVNFSGFRNSTYTPHTQTI